MSLAATDGVLRDPLVASYVLDRIVLPAPERMATPTVLLNPMTLAAGTDAEPPIVLSEALKTWIAVPLPRFWVPAALVPMRLPSTTAPASSSATCR